MDRIILHRRGLLTLSGAAVLAATTTSVRAEPLPSATVDVLRVCNTAYYPAARKLFNLRPGQALGIAFDHDPGFVEQASAGLWLGGEKVGDAPRRSREWLGRMMNAGRMLTARVEAFRPPTDDSDAACMVRIELVREGAMAPLGRPVSETFLEPMARERRADRVAARLYADTGVAPVFLGGGCIAPGVHRPAAGEILRVVAGPATEWRRGQALCETMDGAPVGRLCADQRLMARRMAEAGLTLCAVALEASPGGEWVNVAVYLVD